MTIEELKTIKFEPKQTWWFIENMKIRKVLMSEKAKERYKKRPNPNCKKCYCVETSKEWSSIKNCWEEMFKDKYTYSYFQTMLGGHYKNKTTIKKSK